MLSKGSDLKAVENVVGKIVDKQVMAGWRSVTRGTVSFGLLLYWPVRTPILILDGPLLVASGNEILRVEVEGIKEILVR